METALNKETNVTWTFTKTEKKGNQSITTRVRQVENGYIISVDIEGRKSNGEYDYSCKEYISTENPLGDKTEVKVPDVKGLLNSLNEGLIEIS